MSTDQTFFDQGDADPFLGQTIPVTRDAPVGQFAREADDPRPQQFADWAQTTQDNLIAERTRRSYLAALRRLAAKVLRQQGRAIEHLTTRAEPPLIATAIAAAGAENLVEAIRYGGYAPSTAQLLARALLWGLHQRDLVPAGARQQLALHRLRQLLQREWSAAPTGDDSRNGDEQMGDTRMASSASRIRPAMRTIAEEDFPRLLAALASGRAQAGPNWKDRARLFLLATLATAARPAEWQQAHWSEAHPGDERCAVLRLPNYKRQRVPSRQSWDTQVPPGLASAAEADLIAMGVQAALLLDAEGEGEGDQRDAQQGREGREPQGDDDEGEGEAELDLDMLPDRTEVLRAAASLMASSPRLAARAVLGPDGATQEQEEEASLRQRHRLWQELVRLRAWQRRSSATNWREVVVPAARQADVQAHLASLRAHLARGEAFEAYFDGCRQALLRANRSAFPAEDGVPARRYSLYDGRATALANLKASTEEAQAGGDGGDGGGGMTALMVSAAAGHFGLGKRTIGRRYPPSRAAWSRAGRIGYSPLLAVSPSQHQMVQGMQPTAMRDAADPADHMDPTDPTPEPARPLQNRPAPS